MDKTGLNLNKELFDHLIFLLSIFFLLSLKRIHAHLLVVLLEGSQVLSGLGELSLLHALTNVPVDEGPLGVHQVKLVVKPGPGFTYGKLFVSGSSMCVPKLPMAVVLESMQTALGILAMSPPGTTVGGW